MHSSWQQATPNYAISCDLKCSYLSGKLSPEGVTALIKRMKHSMSMLTVQIQYTITPKLWMRRILKYLSKSFFSVGARSLTKCYCSGSDELSSVEFSAMFSGEKFISLCKA